jgi:hypothetical protein
MHHGGSGSLRDFDWSERRWNPSQASMACRERNPAATVSGRYWHHRRPLPPAKEAEDQSFKTSSPPGSLK